MTKRKILIAEDIQMNVKMLQEILEDEYDLLIARDGEQAIEMLFQWKSKISLLLLDIVMPIKDGYEVLRAKKRDIILNKIPVIVMTQRTDSDTDAEQKAFSLGASDFVFRPLKPEVIRHRIRNLIALKEAAVLVQEVTRDVLTGIYNKEGFYRIASDLMVEHPDEEYDIIAFDVERFKLINDSFGAAEGNRLLKVIAGKLLMFAESRNGICARVYADHFLAIIPRNQADYDTLEKNVAVSMQDFSDRMQLSIKIGIYQVEDRKLSVMMMCDCAFFAVESIKGVYGKSYAFYNDEIRSAMIREQEICNEMKKAVENEEFEVYLQPKYDLFSERIAGAEALVRWSHPTKGMIMPGDFIPVFEKNGFITELDFYILEKTAQIIAKRLKNGERCVPISVNISRRDIRVKNLEKQILKVIRKYDVPIEYVHLEITESAYTEQSDELIATVRRLKKTGFVIEMDDFGSGYSSLNMLSLLPIDVLKLDMKFIQIVDDEGDNIRNKNRSNILSFIISLAKWMNLTVVAEGVETDEQVEMLRNMDCTYVQGYYFERPQCVEEFFASLDQIGIAPEYRMQVVHVDDAKVTVRSKEQERVMLIVDDLQMNRDILIKIFQDKYDIVEADNGAVAMEYVQKNYEKIQVIMLDIIMPIMDGYEMLEKLQNDERYKKIPVVVTSLTGESSESKVLRMGATDFMGKPYQRDIALRRVANALAYAELHNE